MFLFYASKFLNEYIIFDIDYLSNIGYIYIYIYIYIYLFITCAHLSFWKKCQKVLWFMHNAKFNFHFSQRIDNLRIALHSNLNHVFIEIFYYQIYVTTSFYYEVDRYKSCTIFNLKWFW